MENKQFLDTETMKIDLVDIFHELLKKWWLIVIGGILGLVLSTAYIQYTYVPTYQSQAMLYVVQTTNTITTADLSLGKAITGDFIIIAKSKPTIDKAIEIIKEEDGIEFTRADLQGMVTVVNEEDTRILKIQATSTNAEHASIVANAMAEATAQQMENIIKKEPPSLVEQAEPSTSPINTNDTEKAFLGFAIGVVFVCAILLIQYLLNDNIKSEEDIEKYLGEVTLVSIPYLRKMTSKKQELKRQKGAKRERAKAKSN